MPATEALERGSWLRKQGKNRGIGLGQIRLRNMLQSVFMYCIARAVLVARSQNETLSKVATGFARRHAAGPWQARAYSSNPGALCGADCLSACIEHPRQRRHLRRWSQFSQWLQRPLRSWMARHHRFWCVKRACPALPMPRRAQAIRC